MNTSKEALEKIAYWAKICSVFGFFISLFFIFEKLGILKTYFIYGTNPDVLFVFLYLFPSTLIYFFSRNLMKGLKNDDIEIINKGFSYLYKFFKVIGILSIAYSVFILICLILNFIL